MERRSPRVRFEGGSDTYTGLMSLPASKSTCHSFKLNIVVRPLHKSCCCYCVHEHVFAFINVFLFSCSGQLNLRSVASSPCARIIKRNIRFLDDPTGACQGQTGAGGLLPQHVLK